MGDNLITIRSADSAHWYDKDGNPRHDATLREARKEFLLPSVTSILSIKEKPALVNWKVAQILSQALTMHREPDESDDAFIERVKAADEEERAKAPDKGSEVHRQIADYVRGLTEDPRCEGVDLGPVKSWIDLHTFSGKTEVRFASPLGFGGCIDYEGTADGNPALIDWKTQSVKLDKKGNPSPAFYDEWCWQLAAYQHAPRIYLTDTTPELWSVIIDTARPGCYAKQWTPEDAERGWQGFQGCMAVWQADRKYNPAG